MFDFDWFKNNFSGARTAAPKADDGSAFFNALRESPNPIPAGNYAMWFPSPEEMLFANSASLRAIDRLYRATTGIEEAVLALILHQCGRIGPEVRRVSFPEDTEVMPLLTVGNQLLLVSVNQEKGIRLHFHESTPLKLRIGILSTMATYIEGRRATSEAQFRRDGPGNCTGTEWWMLSREVGIALRAKDDPLLFIGKLVYY